MLIMVKLLYIICYKAFQYNSRGISPTGITLWLASALHPRRTKQMFGFSKKEKVFPFRCDRLPTTANRTFHFSASLLIKQTRLLLGWWNRLH